jgi:hypothetical protein
VRAGIALAVGSSCIGQPTQLKPNATQIGALTALLLTQNLSRKIELFNRFLLID